MKTHSLLSLFLFSCARGGTTINPEAAIARLLYVIGKVEDAICNPRSQERRQLESLGYCALVLIGALGDEAAICFDKGNRVRIADDGRGIVEEGIMGSENVCDMLAWLFPAYHYALWVQKVHAARDSKTRPPVFNITDHSDVDPRVMTWLGVEAEAYLAYWKMTRRAEAAARAASESPQTLELTRVGSDLDDSHR